MASPSRSHAADRLDSFMSRFGPWELINYVPEGHSFTVAIDSLNDNRTEGLATSPALLDVDAILNQPPAL